MSDPHRNCYERFIENDCVTFQKFCSIFCGEINNEIYTNLDVYFCYLTGAVAGLLVGLLTEYYTSHDFKPVREVAKSSETGAATNIIFGLALGYHSFFWSGGKVTISSNRTSWSSSIVAIWIVDWQIRSWIG